MGPSLQMAPDFSTWPFYRYPEVRDPQVSSVIASPPSTTPSSEADPDGEGEPTPEGEATPEGEPKPEGEATPEGEPEPIDVTLLASLTSVLGTLALITVAILGFLFGARHAAHKGGQKQTTTGTNTKQHTKIATVSAIDTDTISRH